MDLTREVAPFRLTRVRLRFGWPWKFSPTFLQLGCSQPPQVEGCPWRWSNGSAWPQDQGMKCGTSWDCNEPRFLVGTLRHVFCLACCREMERLARELEEKHQRELERLKEEEELKKKSKRGKKDLGKDKDHALRRKSLSAIRQVGGCI